MSESKRITTHVEFKADAATGEFSAVFATFNQVDHDGDVTRPGAFANGAEVIVGAWGHRIDWPPIGKGFIRVSAADARVEGRLFLSTTQGKDAYQTLKDLGRLAQWSYTFKVLRQSFGEFAGQRVRFLDAVQIFSVDPVLAGAGIDTHTVAIKHASTDGLPGAERGELLAIRDENILRREVAAAKATLATLPKPVEHNECDAWLINPAARDAAKAGIERSARRLGISIAELKWFTQPAAATPQKWGFNEHSEPAPVVWIRADVVEPEAAYAVACHEMRHLAQAPAMSRRAAEDDANAFEAMMLAEL
jgi:hypothetical protein